MFWRRCRDADVSLPSEQDLLLDLGLPAWRNARNVPDNHRLTFKKHEALEETHFSWLSTDAERKTRPVLTSRCFLWVWSPVTLCAPRSAGERPFCDSEDWTRMMRVSMCRRWQHGVRLTLLVLIETFEATSTTNIIHSDVLTVIHLHLCHAFLRVPVSASWGV